MKLSTAIRVAVYTVLVFAATAMLAVETPATGGYFDLGEAAIYSIAVFTPPLATAIAAGVGSALADLALGYGIFAPATLVIKFCEGLVVSKLVQIVRRRGSPPLWLRVLTPVVGGGIAATIATLAFGSGGVSASIGLVPIRVFGVEIPLPTVSIGLPPIVWWVIAGLVVALSIATAVTSRYRPYVVCMAVGGMIMVTGYFLYEYFVSNPLTGRPPIAALFEVPVNVGQFAAGIVIAHAVIGFVERARGLRR
ncbi:MAG: ECF transporter S component [Crenarchaeota archaeon]|nr:ECF transporter S component [Thermoproteota archaeon]